MFDTPLFDELVGLPLPVRRVPTPSRPPAVEFKPVPRTVAPPIAELIEEAEIVVPLAPPPPRPPAPPPPTVRPVVEFKPVPRTVAPTKSELPVFDDEDDVLEIIPASVFEPMPAESFVHKRIGGALRGFVTGGPVGAAAGFIAPGGGAPRAQVVTDPCPGGFVLPGGKCFETPIVPQRVAVEPQGLGLTPLGGGGGVQVGTVSAGMFGALSTEPLQVSSFRLQCPKGLVLGKDERCYAKGTIPPKLRKWRPATRPPITAGDVRAIRRAASAKGRVKKLGKDVGLHLHVHRRTAAAKKGKK